MDPTINPQCMEMYADEDSRGGILEPDGIIGIKFRKERQLETMARLDPVYAELKRRSSEDSVPADELSSIKVKMAEREKALLPVYAQIAHQFADLHDRAGRMVAKGTVRKALQWSQARRFFYWRLRRRLNEDYVIRRMRTVQSAEQVSNSQLLDYLRSWSSITDFDRDDMSVALWYEENRKDIAVRMEKLKREGTAFDVAALLTKDREGGLDGVAQVLSMLPVQEKEAVMAYLSKA